MSLLASATGFQGGGNAGWGQKRVEGGWPEGQPGSSRGVGTPWRPEAASLAPEDLAVAILVPLELWVLGKHRVGL